MDNFNEGGGIIGWITTFCLTPLTGSTESGCLIKLPSMGGNVSDAANFLTHNVENMSVMFEGATSFNQPIAGWNVSRVTDMANFNEGAALLVELPPFA